MSKQKYNILLADDDEDDYMFFKEALNELPFSVKLEGVNDGVYLMNHLFLNLRSLPDILFLDLNMPRKTGFECLTEIKQIDILKQLPIIILSTFLDFNIIDELYKKGVLYYIQKPNDFFKLKKVIGDSLTTIFENNYKQPVKDYFVLKP